MSKKQVVEGLFQITGFSAYGSSKVHLEKDGKTYSVSLRRLGNRIIGKTHLELRLFLSDAGNWLIWNRNTEAWLPRLDGMSGYTFRTKEVINDSFYVKDYENLTGKRSANTKVILISRTTAKKYEAFLYDIKSKLINIYNGSNITLIESTIGGSYIWKIKQ